MRYSSFHWRTTLSRSYIMRLQGHQGYVMDNNRETNSVNFGCELQWLCINELALRSAYMFFLALGINAQRNWLHEIHKWNKKVWNTYSRRRKIHCLRRLSPNSGKTESSPTHGVQLMDVKFLPLLLHLMFYNIFMYASFMGLYHLICIYIRVK